MKGRLKALRKELRLTQQEFADRVGISRGNIGAYEVGKNAPSDAVISLICREFHVNEEWLRTGNGEMFVEETPDEEFMRMAKAVASGDTETDRMIRRTLMYFYEMDDLGRKTLMNFVKYISGNDEPSGGTEHFPATPEELEEKYPPIEEEGKKKRSS
ncbi:helix-turn-helix domain-containing protein [uncultured Clostridium sp.]|uniref:helix-turn-helix domain-containing protein n=1 Tax=uncultured Clostridium sp. TaxID=59620 RepID=UPI00266ED081|nr:helix-turn-helix domain-containing protein [uncultured Clostridium sp.]